MVLSVRRMVLNKLFMFPSWPFGSFLEFSYARPQASLRDNDLSEAIPILPSVEFVLVSPADTLTASSTVRFSQNSTEWPPYFTVYRLSIYIYRIIGSGDFV